VRDGSGWLIAIAVAVVCAASQGDQSGQQQLVGHAVAGLVAGSDEACVSRGERACVCGAFDHGAHCVSVGLVCDGLGAGWCRLARWSGQCESQCVRLMGQDG
jgi:hypothetical protein